MNSGRMIRAGLLALALLAVAAVNLSTPALAADVEVHWDSGLDGTWGSSLNWSPMVVPDNTAGTYYWAILDHPNIVVVNLLANVVIDSLFVDADDEVAIENSRMLAISAANGRLGIENRGVISLNSSTTYTYLRLNDGPIRLTGGGTVLAHSGTFYNMVGGLSGGELINVDNTFRGAMNLGYNQLRIENGGMIVADDPLLTLRLDPSSSGMTNTGLIRAENGALLEMGAADYNNTGGVIEAIDGSTVSLLASAIVTGGILQTSGSGVIVSNSSSARIADLTSQARVHVANTRSLYLKGGIANSDTISIDSSTTYAYLRTVEGTVTLTGGGVIACDTGQYALIGSVDGSALVNTDNTIRGSVHLGYNQIAIQNAGLIVADNPVHSLKIDPSADGLVNTGVMRAEYGAVMQLYTADYDNTGGLIEAADGSQVELAANPIITGGTLRSSGTGEFVVNSSSPKFVDLTCQARVHVTNTRALYLEGTIANSDTISIDSVTTYTYLRTTGGPVTLTSGGVITGGTIQYAIIGSVDGSRLINQDNTIHGAVNLGYNQLGLDNGGTILADHPTFMLNIDPSADGFVNTGQLRVEGAGGLRLWTGPFEQQGTVEIAAGRLMTDDDDFVQTAGMTTVDGTLAMGTGDSLLVYGGVLGGNGVIVGNVVNLGGTVAPGVSVGELTIDGTFAQEAGGVLSVEIGGYTPGTEYDVLTITGDATLAGQVDVSFPGGFVPAVDDTFVILAAASVFGELTVVTGHSFPPGILPWVALRGNDVVLTIEQISITGAEQEQTPAARPLTVSPNPSSSGHFAIDYALADKSADVSIVVYDVAGRRVCVLPTGPGAAASSRLSWDGRADDGRIMPGGVYFLRLTTGSGHQDVKRMTIVR